MEPLNITITDLSLDTVLGESERYGAMTLADAIVNAAVADITKDEAYREVYGGLRKRIGAIRDEEIRARVTVELDEAMRAPIVATNQWGEPVAGKGTTTVRELILAEAKQFFTEKTRTDSYSNTPALTGAQRVIAALVKEQLTKELTAVFAAEKEKVVAALRATAADLVADAVKKGLGR